MKNKSCNPHWLILALGLFGLLSSPPANAATVNVDIQNFAFNPLSVTINVGDSVIWTQRDTTAHTATSDIATGPGAFNSGNLTLARPTYTNTFNSAGTFNYHCIPHPFMTGTVIVQAAANTPPTVSITSPINGAVFTAGDNITINATATDSDGTVAAVEFREGANVLGTAATSPYSFVWNNVVAGTYTLTAVATDNLGANATSAPVTITVVAAANAPPTVSLTSPVNGDAFTAGTNITLTAVAADSDGTVASVEFREGTNVLGKVTSSPYTITWSNVPAGTYTLTAEATDNLGQATASSAVTITVATAPSQPLNITIALAGTNAVSLTWTGGTAPYLVQTKTNLSDTNWVDVTTTTNQSALVTRVGNQAFFQIVDPVSITVATFTAPLSAAAEPPAVTTSAGGLENLSSSARLSAPAVSADIQGPSNTSDAVGVLVPFSGDAAGSAAIQEPGTGDTTILPVDPSTQPPVLLPPPSLPLPLPPPPLALPPPVLTLPPPVLTLPPPVLTLPPPVLTLPPPVLTLPPPVLTLPPPVLALPPPVLALPPPVLALPPPVLALPPPVLALPPPVLALPPPVLALPPPVLALPPPVLALPPPPLVLAPPLPAP